MSQAKTPQTRKDYYHLNEELENYFANTIIPQLFVDSNLVLRKFTPPAMSQFSFTEEDVDRDFHEVKDHIKYPTILENIEEVIETGEILEKEIQTTDGEWYQMNILPYLVRRENRTNGVIITFVNITERVSNLRELEKLNNRYHTLIFALAHDIRQPLTNILLLKEGLKAAYDKENSELFELLIDRLHTTTIEMKDLVTDFVAENNSQPDIHAKNDRVNIQQIVKEVLSSFKQEIHTHKIKITTDFKATEIKFSRTNLRSIVYNLLGNAIKFRDKKMPLNITIHTVKKEDHVLLEITDTGNGIAEENLDLIFKKSHRINKEVEGTGMGLYIIKRMVENNNGKINVKSTLGKGSTFSIYFPA